MVHRSSSVCFKLLYLPSVVWRGKNNRGENSAYVGGVQVMKRGERETQSSSILRGGNTEVRAQHQADRQSITSYQRDQVPKSLGEKILMNTENNKSKPE